MLTGRRQGASGPQCERQLTVLLPLQIGAHLARYPTTLEDDERAMARGAEGADEEAVLALRFAHFEKALLADALAALRAAMGDSPPESLSYVVAGAKGRHLERSYFAQA